MVHSPVLMEKIMRKSNDTSKLGHVTLEGHRALADGELALVSAGVERQKKQITSIVVTSSARLLTPLTTPIRSAPLALFYGAGLGGWP
jgi:hypothetical protein